MLKLAAYVQTFLGRFDRDEEGQTMAEYAVILAVISVAVVGALALLSGNISNVINRIADAISLIRRGGRMRGRLSFSPGPG